MLAFLTDAHISPSVAKQVKAKQPEIVIRCLRDWRGGALLDAADEVILSAALEEGLSFVTYDQRTIVSRPRRRYAKTPVFPQSRQNSALDTHVHGCYNGTGFMKPVS